MNILSIQSQVVYGHVGNSAAAFALQRLGAEVWALPTLLYSNHPGHGPFAGRTTPADDLFRLAEGLDRLGLLAAADGALIGYLGEADQAEALIRILALVRERNPEALVLVDPVMGDDGRLYVSEAIARAVADRLLPLADIATPNHFELEHLLGRTIADSDAMIAGLRELTGRLRPEGHRVAAGSRIAEDGIEAYAARGDAVWRVTTPILPSSVKGAGDLFAALFLGDYLKSRRAEFALERAVAGCFGIIARSGGEEMALIAAQEELVRPTRRFKAERIG